MKRIYNQTKLEHYIEKYSIEDFFGVDMKKYMELHIFEKGSHLVKTNEPIDYFYFFVEGKVKVYTVLKNGKSLLFRLYKPMIIIGDVEFIDCDTANSNIEAINECLCIGISMSNIRRYAVNDSTFLKCMCASLGKKFISSSIASSINILYPLENRLSSYLLAITPENSQHSNLDGGIITDKFTEMADLLGTSYRHLIRTINKLCQENIIKKEKNSIVILNIKALEALAGDLYE
ncbi:cyclic nucleotide-binding domain-containing protein [Clostridium estertheticum]|uniref:cyclic nucleotide-binding domain-containing protein n=1 Tax=Clostridium estertheticum TaxID=238834 RepID=UPI0013E924AE|nr:cyclic nucleotide-binding domain-containing protein [Clostridium estertheticum]MBZ9687234.1 cyclic nucleotide-binding domain-containing protein [Clostridium estertheticum]